MGELFLPLCIASSLLNGVYVEPDRGMYYFIDKRQHIVTPGLNRVSPIIRANVQNKSILLRRIYEK